MKDIIDVFITTLLVLSGIFMIALLVIEFIFPLLQLIYLSMF